MKTPCILLGVALSALWLRSLSVVGQTLHYDEAELHMYSRVTQQLRKTMDRKRAEAIQRGDAISADAAAMFTQLDAQMAAATDTLSNAFRRVADLYTGMTKVMTPMVSASATASYTSASLPLYGNVLLDYGMGYSASTGIVVIVIPGIYMLDYKVQTADYSGCYSRIVIKRSDGTISHTISTYHDWEVSPFFNMLDLEVGDEVQFQSLSLASSSASCVTAGTATRFNLRFLGKSV